MANSPTRRVGMSHFPWTKLSRPLRFAGVRGDFAVLIDVCLRQELLESVRAGRRRLSLGKGQVLQVFESSKKF
jgi:hypothetical protein